MSPNVHWKRAQRSDRSCGKSARSSPSECCSYKRSGTQPKSLMRTDRPSRSGWQSLDWHRGSPKATLLTLQHHRQQVSTLQQKPLLMPCDMESFVASWSAWRGSVQQELMQQLANWSPHVDSRGHRLCNLTSQKV